MSNQKTLDKLIQDQEFMAKSQAQLFENLNIVVENLKHKSDQQSLIVKNQNLIIRNQEIIVDNQINIINNQKQIVGNQDQLHKISKILGLVLNLLRKLDGNKESLGDTYQFIESFEADLKEDQLKQVLIEAKSIGHKQ